MSEALREFILKSIDSMGLVEVLLMLYRDRQREWTAEEASRELRSSVNSVNTHVRRLRELGFACDRTGGARFGYCAPSEELGALMPELAEVYNARRNSLIDFIYRDRSRDEIQSFADAFKWRKE